MTDLQWRDLAAGMAMLGLLASGERGDGVAIDAYKYADDLLDEKTSVTDMGLLGIKKRKTRVSKQETS